jgi:hypothetical protein
MGNAQSFTSSPAFFTINNFETFAIKEYFYGITLTLQAN